MLYLCQLYFFYYDWLVYEQNVSDGQLFNLNCPHLLTTVGLFYLSRPEYKGIGLINLKKKNVQ